MFVFFSVANFLAAGVVSMKKANKPNSPDCCSRMIGGRICTVRPEARVFEECGVATCAAWDWVFRMSAPCCFRSGLTVLQQSAKQSLRFFDGRVFDQRGLCGAWVFRSALYFVVRGIVLDLCLCLVLVGLGLAGASVQ